MRAAFCLTAIVGFLSVAGCGGLAPSEPKDLKDKLFDVVPLTGTVVIDGSPSKQVIVSAFPEKILEDWKQIGTRPSLNDPLRGAVMGAIKDDGTFGFQTYKPNDGLPAGVWIVLFCKPVPGLDAFNNKYNDPTTSTYKVTLEKGSPKDLGKVELSTK